MGFNPQGLTICWRLQLEPQPGLFDEASLLQCTNVSAKVIYRSWIDEAKLPTVSSNLLAVLRSSRLNFARFWEPDCLCRESVSLISFVDGQWKLLGTYLASNVKRRRGSLSRSHDDDVLSAWLLVSSRPSRVMMSLSEDSLFCSRVSRTDV
jgi:hypothetical protein